MPKPGTKSSTAEAVLAGVWLTACDPATSFLAPPDLANYSYRALKAIGNPLAWMLKLGIMRSIGRRKEASILPGVCGHYAARKVAIARLVEASHPQSLVVLGAGLDGLAYRMSKRINAFEIDWPASQDRKRKVLEKIDPSPLTLIAADISKPGFLSALPPFDPGSAVFVAEGLLMYFSEEEVRQVLAEAATRTNTFVFTFMGLTEGNRPGFPGSKEQVDRYLAKVGEPFKWGIEPARIGDFLHKQGWTLQALLGASGPGTQGFEVVPGMIPGEYIAHAKRDFK